MHLSVARIYAPECAAVPVPPFCVFASDLSDLYDDYFTHLWHLMIVWALIITIR